mgnify:CR=1 FL=1
MPIKFLSLYEETDANVASNCDCDCYDCDTDSDHAADPGGGEGS